MNLHGTCFCCWICFPCDTFLWQVFRFPGSEECKHCVCRAASSLLLCCFLKVLSGPGWQWSQDKGTKMSWPSAFLVSPGTTSRIRTPSLIMPHVAALWVTRLTGAQRGVVGPGRGGGRPSTQFGSTSPCPPCYLPLSFVWSCLETERNVQKLSNPSSKRNSKQLPSLRVERGVFSGELPTYTLLGSQKQGLSELVGTFSSAGNWGSE